jgi:hypothetical protein
MEYLETNETVNDKQARAITFIHEDWKVKGIFRRVEKNKMIKQVRGTITSQVKYRKWTKEDDNQGDFELKLSDRLTSSISLVQQHWPFDAAWQ